MERGDLITLVAGIAIVIIIAVAVKMFGVGPSPAQEVTISTPEHTETLQNATSTPVFPSGVTVTTRPAIPDSLRITYTLHPLRYPVIRIPDSMETFGGSDIPWKNPDIVAFAYLKESQGGLSKEFNVPYDLWGMNISVEAWTKPQYARFEMVLCSAEDGSVLEGIEILNRGTAFRSVQVADSDMYMIIHTENVDRFRIDFVTPKDYYDSVQKTISVKTE